MALIPRVENLLRAPSRSGIESVLASIWRFRPQQRPKEKEPVDLAVEVAGGRMRRQIQDGWLFPDPKRFWAAAALKPACKLAERDPIDLVWATGFPWSSFRLARDIARAIDRPYALDYRDAWTSNPRRIWDSDRQRSLEAELFEGASLVTAATDWIRDDLRERFGGSTPVETMTNGYDSSELPEADPALEDGDRCILTYTGTFNDAWPPAPGDQSPWWLLRAIESLPASARCYLRIRLVGRVPKSIISSILETGLSDVVEVVPFVAHARALQHQLAADHLLLIVSDAPGSAGILTGKLVEYAGARRPVLALAPEGEASRMISEHRLGTTVPPRDIGTIVAALQELVDRWRREGRPDPTPDVLALDARALIGTLANRLHAGIRGYDECADRDQSNSTSK